MKYPFKIPQSQPKEGDGTYLQQNFPQGPLTLNASINDPKVRVLTPPWAMHRPDEPCPYYAPGGEFKNNRGKVETGYKLDYGRTNHEINVKSNLNKNKWSRIRQMKANEFINITDPDFGTVDITDQADNKESFRRTVSSTPMFSNRVEMVNRSNGNTKEAYNTIRSENHTAGNLNNYQFYAPNGVVDKHNRPINPMRGESTIHESSSAYIPIEDLSKYTDVINIHDDSPDETGWGNASEKERYCPLKAAIKAKQEAAERSWKAMSDNETVNREYSRSNIHKRVDNREPLKKYHDTNNHGIDNIKNTDQAEGFYFNGKKVAIKDRFADQKLYEKYTGKYKKEKFNAAKNGITKTPVKEGFYCQCQPYLDNMYKHILEARASAIVMYLLKDQSFRPWMHHWEFLQRNINKCNMDFNQLEDDHEDVAFSMDKGKQLAFRFRDKDKYMPLSVESYVLAHEMAHVANEEIGHGEKFQELMHLIEVAAYMLQFIDLSKYSDSTVHSNGQEILSRRSIKYELIDGINNLISHSEDPEQREYWEQIRKRVENNK